MARTTGAVRPPRPPGHNNTRHQPGVRSLLDVDQAAAAKILGVNSARPLAWIRLARDAWMGEHGGSVCQTWPPIAGIRASLGIGMYGVSKAALMRVTPSSAPNSARRIRVNAVAPAVVKTRFAEALYEGREEQVAAA
ncbi:SDR family oxidoreductase [Kitasatospora albolonga]|uniref:SDR family oxidoreductase n=1 Tax=Kitasatospora albolonga TaxID=68173 RepID=UPI0031EF52FC